MTPLWLIHQKLTSYYEVDYLEPFMDSRKRKTIYLRQVFQFLARKLNGKMISYDSIGNYYSDATGNQWTHATVMNGVRKVDGYIENERELRLELLDLLSKFPSTVRLANLKRKIENIENKYLEAI